MSKSYTMCKHCDHFVDESHVPPNVIYLMENTTITLKSGDKVARYIHLEDEEGHDFDHDAEPGETRDDWNTHRPDLFIEHEDGRIGPNSSFHSNQRGKTVKPFS